MTKSCSNEDDGIQLQIAVMVAAAVANLLQPSAYDAMIEIKNLPFLPATIDPEICKYAFNYYNYRRPNNP